MYLPYDFQDDFILNVSILIMCLIKVGRERKRETMVKTATTNSMETNEQEEKAYGKAMMTNKK